MCTGQCRGFRWMFTFERTTTLTSPWRALRKKHIPCMRSSSAAGRTQHLLSVTTERNQTRWVLHNNYCRTYISRFLHIRPKNNILFRITDVVRFRLSQLYLHLSLQACLYLMALRFIILSDHVNWLSEICGILHQRALIFGRTLAANCVLHWHGLLSEKYFTVSRKWLWKLQLVA